MKNEILLFTGWGATCDVWKPIIPALSERYQVDCHQPSWVMSKQKQYSLQDFDLYINLLADSIKNPVYIVAWSMGGLLAIALAKKFPQLVNKICFIASVPCFVAKGNPHAGIDYEWFQSFNETYDRQPLKALKRFQALQVQNDIHAKATLMKLKNICPLESYDLSECGYALAVLAEINLQQDLYTLSIETSFIHGKNDAVINLQAARYAASATGSLLHIIETAGHVPQLSHTDQVLQVINQMLDC